MSIDEALDEFVAAWMAGMAPSVGFYSAMASEADRELLAELVGAWLVIAPTVVPHPARLAELLDDPLVRRLADLEW